MTKRAKTVADIDSTAQLAPPKNALFRRPRPAMPSQPRKHRKAAVVRATMFNRD